jgi:hypothetical protein
MARQRAGHSRGFALTLDATLAVIVLVIFSSVYAFLSYQAAEEAHVPLVLEKEADDLLIVLDKIGVLSSRNETLMNHTLNATLPAHLKWNMEMQYYNYTDGFELDSNSTFGWEYNTSSRRAVAQREFVVVEQREVLQYGIARLRLWVE